MKKTGQTDPLFSVPRVLMFVPQYPYPVVGGLEKQSHELSKALRDAGVNVEVLSGKIYPTQSRTESVEGVSVTRVPWAASKIPRFALAPFFVAAFLLRNRARFNVVHVHQHSWAGLYVILLSKLLGKSVITKLPNVGGYGIPGLRRKFLGWLRLRILCASDVIVAMSKQSFLELRDAGYPAKQVLLTTNGITLFPRPLRHALGTAPVRVVFVGRLSEEKRLDVLFDAWSLLAAEGVNAILEIWGQGPLELEMKQRSTRLGVSDRVLFRGHVEDVTRKLADMDIFVLPSRAEGNSNAILEAMTAGLPVVSTPVGGTPVLVGKEGAPFLFPVGDVEPLKRQLERLIRNADLRREAGLG
jgi:glycosyltransferase involved in cell wall biosynthesis